MKFSSEETEVLKRTADSLGITQGVPDFDRDFEIPKEDDPLFGERKEANLRTEYFVFLWKIAEEKTKKAAGRELFMPGALSAFKEAFLDTLSGLWYEPAKETAESLCGKMPFPYREWLEEKLLPAVMSGEHFRETAMRFPVLGVQALIVTKNYARHIIEVMEAVKECEFLTKEHGAVRSVSASESDWHDHCRSVHILTFTDGEKIVYKPHSMAVDRGFTKWLDAMCDYANEEHFPLTESFDCKSGAFCRFIKHNPLKHPSDAGLFYHRMGFLMGAVYSLGGYDMHAENIIAEGAFPLPVDLETVLLSPDHFLTKVSAKEKLKGIHTAGFLPMLLSPPGIAPSGADSLTGLYNSSVNLPFYDDTVLRGSDYTDQICEGFTEFFDVLGKHQKEAYDILLSAFENVQIRVVIRATASYLRLLNFYEKAANLKSAEAYNKYTCVAGSFGDVLSDTEKQMIQSTEREAMLRLDVPKFDVVLTKASVDAIHENMSGMDEAFIQKQTDIIRFILNNPGADAGVDSEVFSENEGNKKYTPDDGNNLSKLIKYLMDYLDGGIVPIVEATANRRYYAGTGFGNSPYLLEGGLGAYLALGAYATAYDDEDVRLFLYNKRGLFTDIHNLGNAMSLRAPGMQDGLGGLIRGLCLCYEMGLFTQSELEPVFAAVYRDVLKPGSLRLLPPDFMHGAAGLLYAVKHIPEELRGDTYEDIVSALSKTAGDKAVNDLPLLVAKGISGNHTLLYGNAGILYRLAGESDSSFPEGETYELMNVLQNATAPVDGATAPDGFAYTGLFSGMSGILYALSRFKAPDKVPRI